MGLLQVGGEIVQSVGDEEGRVSQGLFERHRHGIKLRGYVLPLCVGVDKAIYALEGVWVVEKVGEKEQKDQ